MLSFLSILSNLVGFGFMLSAMCLAPDGDLPLYAVFLIISIISFCVSSIFYILTRR
jgi:hypothetical protein